MSKSRVTSRDRGARHLLKLLEKQSGLRLRVGVFGEAAVARAVDSELTMGDLATVHEFGRGNVPERSFVRSYFDENQARIREMYQRVGGAVVANKIRWRQGLELVGLKIVGEIKGRISAGIAPALSKNYLPRKLAKYPGATNPLIASGQLRQAVASAVVTVAESK